MSSQASGSCPFANMPSEQASDSLSYNSYLMVPELLNLQVCQSDPAHHDEPLFIIIHQTYELWFKLVLHEMDVVFSLLEQNNARRAVFFLRRITAILKLLVQQIHILETMSPKDFLGFRYSLNPASGFQSSQFREVEFAGGLKNRKMLEHFKNDAQAYQKLTKRFQEPSLRDAFYSLLERKGFKLPPDDPQADEKVREQLQEERIKELLKIYNDPERHADLHELCESLLDVDEQIYLWRTHHVTVVERIIGFKRGTGGSEGVAYLRTTLDKRCFDDLWKLRTHLEL